MHGHAPILGHEAVTASPGTSVHEPPDMPSADADMRAGMAGRTDAVRRERVVLGSEPLEAARHDDGAHAGLDVVRDERDRLCEPVARAVLRLQ